MSDYTPTTEGVRSEYIFASEHLPSKAGREFDRWLAAELATAKANAWDEGHVTRWRRGPDGCRCEAWNSGECGCMLYGTGKLLSLDDNPYRSATEKGTDQ